MPQGNGDTIEMSPSSLTPFAHASTADTGAQSLPAVNCPATMAILLAGQSSASRTAFLARSLGLPTAALPIDGEYSVAERWIGALADAGFRGTIVLAVVVDSDARFYARIAAPAGVQIEVRVDTAEHRGAAGTVGDIWRERVPMMSPEDHCGGLLVIEASNAPNINLRKFLSSIDLTQGALIGSSTGAIPSGAMWIAASALECVPAIGFFDFKEQLIPAMTAVGLAVAACVTTDESCRISDRQSYLQAIALVRGSGGAARAVDAVIEPGATVRGNSVLCRGCVVERGALVVDSVILPGARVCADAVVARSIVPPGTHVPCGYLVVDQVFGELGSSEKSGTEGGAS